MSSIVGFGCGCSIMTDEFNGMTRSVYHCQEHNHLFSDEKTLKEMAREIRELAGIKMALTLADKSKLCKSCCDKEEMVKKGHPSCKLCIL